ncbi:pilin [Pseudoalteromonas byunsanensis]|uniref:Pilin n=1 Tax=Pseudoalteromonas byunsanensis TaxID=327939 RepID=A0A1S1N497_9GAMM|nr:pilin [Pseudoalteromonas byunsanensis]OHU94153.1 pilin [Pseudoalteromonas byunsanensis]
MARQQQGGFTLIELMIVVAIIGILSAVALPAYQDYVARSQASEAVSLSAGAKTALAEYYQINGSFPTENTTPTTTSLGATGTYSKLVVNDGGEIVVTMDENDAVTALQGETFTFTAVTTDNAFKWTCVSSLTDANLVPQGCSATATTTTPTGP